MKISLFTFALLALGVSAASAETPSHPCVVLTGNLTLHRTDVRTGIKTMLHGLIRFPNSIMKTLTSGEDRQLPAKERAMSSRPRT